MLLGISGLLCKGQVRSKKSFERNLDEGHDELLDATLVLAGQAQRLQVVVLVLEKYTSSIINQDPII